MKRLSGCEDQLEQFMTRFSGVRDETSGGRGGKEEEEEGRTAGRTKKTAEDSTLAQRWRLRNDGGGATKAHSAAADYFLNPSSGARDILLTEFILMVNANVLIEGHER